MTTARYLVTGGAGFIGSHIAEALLGARESVRIFDNLATGRESNLTALEERAQFVQGDLRDLASVRAAMQGVEVVFHQGALASVPRSIADPIGSLETNINGTQNVLLAARDSGVRRVVYASSSSVYGNTPTLPKREDMPTHPMSPYAVQKLSAELLCGVFTRIYGLETVALRYFNVFGPRQDPASEYAAVIPRFLTALIEKRRPIVFGDGEQTRDFTYIANVVQANLLAASAPDAVGYALNHWKALGRYLEQGYLAIDNNLSERTLRAIALGRNNWGVVGSEAGGEMAAVLYSVVGTCKHLGIDPFAYLRDALPGLFALGEEPTAEQLLDWLPDRWLLHRTRDNPVRDLTAG